MNSDKQLNLELFNEHVFVERFGGLYEHSPWISEKVWEHIFADTFISLSALVKIFQHTVDAASHEQQLALLRAHPELAGKAATEGKLTTESTDEQTRARLDLCSPAEFEKFHLLNSAYNKKFEFPFIMAVRNSTRAEILQAFDSRLHNSPEQEFSTALAQVHQIAELRLNAYAQADAFSELTSCVK